MDTDDGDWMVFHPDEIVATFLLPLPDPVPIADGVSIPTYQRIGGAAAHTLEPWASQLWLQRIDGPGIAPYLDITEGSAQAGTGNDIGSGQEPEHKRRVNFSNKWSLQSSVQFHQTYSDAALRLGLEPALRLTDVISGPRLSRDEVSHALHGTPAPEGLDLSELRDLAIGAVTVAECYVGLRIVSDLPHLQSPLTQGVEAAPPFGPLEADRVLPEDRDLWPWRVFAPGSHVDPELIERRVRNALRVAIGDLRSIQRAVLLWRRSPTIIVAQPRLPIVVPVVLRRASEVGDATKRPSIALLATSPNLTPLLTPEFLDDGEMASLNRARNRADGGPFAAHADVHREAHIALARWGDYRLAALLSGIAAESLFDELLLHLLWEEGSTPEAAASGWIAGLDARVRRHLPGRLGGNWDVSGRGPIADWAGAVAALRHRVAHAAYTPTEEEAVESFDAVNALVRHLCDRLATANTLKKYPRTALALAGEKGLRRRGAYSRRINDLATDPSEVAWNEVFLRWREAWRRIRQDLTSTPRVPDPTSASLLAVRHPDRALRWVLHHRTAHLAIDVDVNAGELPEGMLHRIHAVADLQQDAHSVQAISIALEHDVKPTFPADGLWVEEYHYVPLAGVMVDKSDYRQPLSWGITPPPQSTEDPSAPRDRVSHDSPT